MADGREKEDFKGAKENLSPADESAADDVAGADEEEEELASEEDEFESDDVSSAIVTKGRKSSKPDSRRILSPMILRPVIPTPQIMRRLSQGILQEEISQHKPGVAKSLLKSHSIAGGGTGIHRMRDLRSHHPPPRRKSSTFGSTFGSNHDTMSGTSLQRSQMYKSEER